MRSFSQLDLAVVQRMKRMLRLFFGFGWFLMDAGQSKIFLLLVGILVVLWIWMVLLWIWTVLLRIWMVLLDLDSFSGFGWFFVGPGWFFQGIRLFFRRTIIQLIY